MRKVILLVAAIVAGCSLETIRHNRSEIEVPAIAKNKPKPPSADPHSDSNRLDGVKLYQSHCAGCHGQLAISSKTGRSADDIVRAVAEITNMKFLSTLSLEEIKAISEALNSPSSEILASSPMGTRIYLSTVYQSIFVNSKNALPEENQAILNLVNSYILTQPESHGGPCNRYDNDRDSGKAVYCSKVDRLNDVVLASSEISPLPTITRFGYRVKACEKILALPKAGSNALVNAGIVGTKVDNENLAKVAALFFPGKTLPPFATTELFALAKEASNQKLSPDDQWKFVMLPMCMSFLFDIL